MNQLIILSLFVASFTAASLRAQEKPDFSSAGVLIRWSSWAARIPRSIHSALWPGFEERPSFSTAYHTELVCESQKSPRWENASPISAWVAPQEYSWNLSAIINRQQDFQKGYFFGINQVGQLVGSLALDSGWKTCISAKALPLLKWST